MGGARTPTLDGGVVQKGEEKQTIKDVLLRQQALWAIEEDEREALGNSAKYMPPSQGTR